MADIPKRQKPTIEVVRAGSKPFQVFPQEKTQKRFTPVGKTNIYDRHILLDTNGMLPQLPIRLYAGASHSSSVNSLSPYTEDGYKFTGREIDPQQRAQILDKLDREKEINYAAAPLCIDASIHAGVFRSMKLTEQTQTLPDPLLPEVKETLSRVRFQVALPTKETLDLEHPLYDKFVSRPDETSLALGEFSFRQFTPQESPSLPIPKRYTLQVSEGYFLMIPSEDKIIQKIQGQFIIMPPGTLQKSA